MSVAAAEAMRRGAAILAAAGIDSARKDSELLLAHVLGVTPGRLLLVDALDERALHAFDSAISRRAQRIPLQHITGGAAFGTIEVAVGPGVFVPRPETEFLLEWAVAQAATLGGRPVLADLCSGSGALALGLAALIPTAARVVAVEVDPDAVLWLRRNVSDAAVTPVEVARADVTDAASMAAVLPAAGVDIVVANPPYVPLSAPVAPEVAHDPRRAVFGGADGLSVIAPMLDGIRAALVPGGVVGIEHDDTTSTAVVDLIATAGGFADIVAHRDLAGRPRFVTARRVEQPTSGPRVQG